MSLIRDSYGRFRVLLHEIAKFGVVGALGAVVQFGVQNALHYKLGIGQLTAVFIAYCARRASRSSATAIGRSSTARARASRTSP